MGPGPNLSPRPASSLQKERRSRDRAPVVRAAAALFYSCLRRVRSEGSRNKSIVVAVGINFGAKNGMNQVFFVVIDHCVHIHTHINSFTHTYICNIR